MIELEIKPQADMGVPMQRNLWTKLKCKRKNKQKKSQQNVTPPAPNIVKNKKKKNPAPSCSEQPPAQKLDMVLEALALAGAQQEIHNLKQKVEAKENQLCFQMKKLAFPNQASQQCPISF